MSDKPLVVGGQALSENVIKSPIKSPLGNIRVAKIPQSIYKVIMKAGDKTFNMLLPPSVESKHPGRSNALQLPGLQIKAGTSISKLKIPGFFPIYQHLGVDSLTISMSGMFTGYDGIKSMPSEATNWEAWPKEKDQDNYIKEGQDSYAATSDFYDFAVRNKALVEVTIYTSDGSFIPREGSSNAFRDEQSNIKFKGYVKEFEALYIRQDRNYYMMKFEIIDLSPKNVCKSSEPEKTTKPETKVNPGINDNLVIEYNKLNDKEKNNVKDLLVKRGFLGLENIRNEDKIRQSLIRSNNYYQVKDLKTLVDAANKDTYESSSSSIDIGRLVLSSGVSPIPKTSTSTDLNTKPISLPILVTSLPFSTEKANKISDLLGNRTEGKYIADTLKKNNGVIKRDDFKYVTNPSISSSYTYVDTVAVPQKQYPHTRNYATFTTVSGALLYLVPTNSTNSEFTLKRRQGNEFL